MNAIIGFFKGVAIGFGKWVFGISRYPWVGGMGLDNWLKEFFKYVGPVDLILLLTAVFWVWYLYTTYAFNSGKKSERERIAPVVRKLRRENSDLQFEVDELKEQLAILEDIVNKKEAK